MSDFVRENLTAYTKAMETAEEYKDQVEGILHQLIGVYHGVSIDSYSDIHYYPGGSLSVSYDYTCRGCSDRDAITIPAHVMNADDVIAAAKRDVADKLIAKNKKYHEDLKVEALRNLKLAQQELDRILGTKGD